MQFDPNNAIIKMCLQGMALEEQGNTDTATSLFLQAWHASTNNFEQFYAAWFMARVQKDLPDRLNWLQKALYLALGINDVNVVAAIPYIHAHLAECYNQLKDSAAARDHYSLAESFSNLPTDTGPFYHGTRALLTTGDLLVPGGVSNYNPAIIMNHIYFTALVNGAGLAAALAKGEGCERVYIVVPTGSFEHDPNVTNKRFPGNPTRSYRSKVPLTIVGEVTEWIKQTPEQIQYWREKLANNTGEIIN